MKNRGVDIKLDFIDVTVHVAVTENVMRYRNDTLHKKWPNIGLYEGNPYGICTFASEYPHRVFVTLPYGGGDSILLHELIHAVDYVMEHRGLEGTEFRAYAVEYLFKESLRKLKKI